MTSCTEPSIGALNARGVAKYSDFARIEGYILQTVQDRKLVLITYRKWYVKFRLIPKSAILNDPERHNGPYFALFHRILKRSAQLFSDYLGETN